MVDESQRCVFSNGKHIKRTYYHVLESDILEKVKNGKSLAADFQRCLVTFHFFNSVLKI